MIDARSVPPERQSTDHVYYSMTKSLCGTCKAGGGRQDRLRATTRSGSTSSARRTASSGAGRLVGRVVPRLPLVRRARARRRARIRSRWPTGCPFDCGACASHQQKVYLPVVPITSACNLDCPICYTVNKNDGAHQHVARGACSGSSTTSPRITTSSTSSTSPAASRRCTRELPEFLEMCRDGGDPAAHDLHQRPQAARRGLRAQARRARRAHRALARHVRPGDRPACCSAPTR